MNRSMRHFAGVVLLMLLVALPWVAFASPPPVAPKHPIDERIQDTPIQDDYRWLEDWSNPEVRTWVEGENAHTRAMLDSLPSRPRILERAQTLTHNVTPHYFGLLWQGGALFALKDQPPRNQPQLVRLTNPDDLTNEKVMCDPTAIDPSGSTSIDFYEPALDGSKVAVSLSKGGTESGDIHVFDARTGKEWGEVIPHVNNGTAGGSVAWNAAGDGVWYTRYPAPGERPESDLQFYQQVYFHKFGTPVSEDRYVIGKEFPKIAEIALHSSDDGKRVLVNVSNGDGGQHAFWVLHGDAAPLPVCGFTDRVVDAQFGPDALYLLSRKSSPNGAVLRSPLSNPTLAASSVVVPASETAIDGFDLSGHRIYVQDIVGGPTEMRMFSLGGEPLGKLPLPPVTAVSGFSRFSGDQVLIERSSYTEPSRWSRFDPATGGLTPTAMAMKSPADYSDVEVRREFAVSSDGTKIPLNILMKKGTQLDGHSPVLLYGYGGYGLSQRPGFSPMRKLWIEQGGIYVVANIRGGGEYGDAWHLAGNLTKKQNVFDDFAACAQHLVDRGYTTPEHLACQGGSNGGLLMGAMITQHPKLFGAVVSAVGIYDMLRVETSPNGEFNVTEFGTVKNEDQFKALLGYSPYHHVRPGTVYPSVLLLTGANDPRVSPYQSFKFAAQLQATGTPRPVLLRTSMNTGHIGTPLAARNQESADTYSFLFSQLGLTYKPVATPAP